MDTVWYELLGLSLLTLTQSLSFSKNAQREDSFWKGWVLKFEILTPSPAVSRPTLDQKCLWTMHPSPPRQIKVAHIDMEDLIFFCTSKISCSNEPGIDMPCVLELSKAWYSGWPKRMAASNSSWHPRNPMNPELPTHHFHLLRLESKEVKLF